MSIFPSNPNLVIIIHDILQYACVDLSCISLQDYLTMSFCTTITSHAHCQIYFQINVVTTAMIIFLRIMFRKWAHQGSRPAVHRRNCSGQTLRCTGIAPACLPPGIAQPPAKSYRFHLLCHIDQIQYCTSVPLAGLVHSPAN